MTLSKQSMPETMYRASRCCRVLGNPTAYLLLRCVGGKRRTPSDLSEELEIPLSTVSKTLRHLRHVDLVRYETRGKQKLYWLKDVAVARALDTLEQLVERMRQKRA